MSLKTAETLVAALVNRLGISGGESALGSDGMYTLTLEQPWMPPIHLCYLDADNSMVIFAEIAMLNPDNEAEVLRKMMLRQYLFADSNGVTTALSADDNVLTAQFKFSLEGLTEEGLASNLNVFVGETAKLRVLVCGDNADDNAGSTQVSEEPDGSFIPV